MAAFLLGAIGYGSAVLVLIAAYRAFKLFADAARYSADESWGFKVAMFGLGIGIGLILITHWVIKVAL